MDVDWLSVEMVFGMWSGLDVVVISDAQGACCGLENFFFWLGKLGNFRGAIRQ